MSEWKKVFLGESGTTILDGDRGKQYPSKQELNPSGHCLFLSAANVTKSGFDFTICEFISRDRDAVLRKGKLQRQDSVLTTRGTVGNSAYFDAAVPYDHVRINSGMVIIRPDPNYVHPRFLAFFLRSQDFAEQVKSLTSGSAQPQLPIRDLRRVSFSLPSLSEQREIAATLGALDDKIQLNRRISATLEEMARLIYRSWFLDFDPVRARAEGREPAHMDPATAALFPGSFGEDGLPVGWQNGTLGQVALNPRDIVAPSAISPETPFIGLEHIPRRSISIGDWGKAQQVASTKSKMQVGQFLFGKLRPYFHKVGLVPADGICSTDVLVIAAKAPVWREFVLSVLSSVELVDKVNAASTGTRMPRAKWQDIAAYEIAVPPDKIIRTFSEVVKPIHSRILSIVQENRNLATMRDTLLPRLLSGELRVGAGRKPAEGAT